MTNFTSKSQEQVKEFHEAFGHPVADKPKAILFDRAINRAVWTGEEIIEFIHASSKNELEFRESYFNFLEGLDKAFFKSLAQEFPKTNLERITAQADALIDTKYFIEGSLVELGVDGQQVFDIVQAANMSKLFTDENGNKYAKYREDGKILKSPDFFSPEDLISQNIAEQLLLRKTK